MNMELSPEHPIGVLELFGTSKQSIKLFADLVVDEIKEGRVDPLKIKAFCKSMEAVSEIIDKNTKNEQIKEAEKFGDKPFMNYGCEMHLTSVKTEYDYKSTNDPLWASMNEELIVLKAKIKQREDWLKMTGNPEDVRIDDELVTIYPPIKKTSMGVKITIK